MLRLVVDGVETAPVGDQQIEILRRPGNAVNGEGRRPDHGKLRTLLSKVRRDAGKEAQPANLLMQPEGRRPV